MAKREIYNCTSCGRDTMRSSQICKDCVPNSNISFFAAKPEQKGRSALPMSLQAAPSGTAYGDLDEKRPALSWELRPKDPEEDIVQIW